MTTACEDFIAQLAEAQAALHALLTGKKVVSVTNGDKNVAYDRTSLSALQAYIADLQRKVDACNGVTTNRRRMIRIRPSDC